LPEAHVEASTPGSVILAGILLKLGSYAFIKFILPFKYYVINDSIFTIITISLIGFLHASFSAIIQIDIKKIVAYSSIAHMNFSLIGIFGSTIIGFIGAFTLMLGHAFTSAGLFIGIGILYDRYKTRIIFYYYKINWEFSEFYYIKIIQIFDSLEKIKILFPAYSIYIIQNI
jgi:NADH:ubiquinone oxidoreductase subunit 4 (subunit M)